MEYYIKDIKKAEFEGKEIELNGFVNSIRKGKNNSFLILRDPSGTIQCVSHSTDKSFQDVNKITRESAIKIKGKLRKDERAEGGYEIAIEDLNIYSIAEPYPLKKGHKKVFLLYP